VSPFVRGAFILLGVALLAPFQFLFIVFGAFLLYSAVKTLRSKGEKGSAGAGRRMPTKRSPV
jgi:predicted tellurium resistance membrane protein TerC